MTVQANEEVVPSYLFFTYKFASGYWNIWYVKAKNLFWILLIDLSMVDFFLFPYRFSMLLLSFLWHILFFHH